MTAFMHERHACEPAGEIARDGLPSALPAERALTCRHRRHELDEVRLPRAGHEPDRRQGVPGRNRVDDDLTEVRLPGWRNDREIVRIDLIGNDESRPAILPVEKRPNAKRVSFRLLCRCPAGSREHRSSGYQE
jgi:hypothetical protein